MARDQILSPVLVNATTVFGLCPPELSFVMQQGLYHKWFTRESIRLSKVERCNYVDEMQQQVAQRLSQFYQHCQWIDATAQIVKIRVLTVPSIIDYIKHAPVQDFHTASEKLTVFNFFKKLQKGLEQEASNGYHSEVSRKQWLITKTKFLCDFESK